jgi:hypothetical protein
MGFKEWDLPTTALFARAGLAAWLYGVLTI